MRTRNKYSRLFAPAAVVMLATVSGCTAEPKRAVIDRATAIATAQRLHDELNKLEVAGLIDEQAKYFAEDVMRLDPNRTPRKGREAFLAFARQMRDTGYRPDSSTTTVLDAWVEGTRMVEYGSTMLKVSFGGAAAAQDPVNYLAVWRINPANPADAQIETIIWNTQKPVPQLEAIAKVGR